jgi:hypothetical protein
MKLADRLVTNMRLYNRSKLQDGAYMRKLRYVLQAGLVPAMLAAFATPASQALAQETTYSLTVQNGKFEPSTLAVKAGVKFKLVVSNKGTKPAEFESSELNREKVVPAGASVPLYIGPLAPGAYPFFDDFDQKNRGQIVAK